MLELNLEGEHELVVHNDDVIVISKDPAVIAELEANNDVTEYAIAQPRIFVANSILSDVQTNGLPLSVDAALKK